MNSTRPSAAPTTLYTNAASPAAKLPSSTSSRPPNGRNGGTGGNRNKNNNKNRNSGNDGGNNGKNNNSGGGRGGSSGQTTAPIGSDGRTNTPWQGHSSSNSSSCCTSRPPRPQAGTPDSAQAGISSRWPTPSAPWRNTRPLPRSRTGWQTSARRTTPLRQLVIFLLSVLWPRPLHPSIVVGNGSSLPITSVGDSVLPGPFYLNNILLTPDMV
jgi:hypothetical protein